MTKWNAKATTEPGVVFSRRFRLNLRPVCCWQIADAPLVSESHLVGTRQLLWRRFEECSLTSGPTFGPAACRSILPLPNDWQRCAAGCKWGRMESRLSSGRSPKHCDRPAKMPRICQAGKHKFGKVRPGQTLPLFKFGFAERR